MEEQGKVQEDLNICEEDIIQMTPKKPMGQGHSEENKRLSGASFEDLMDQHEMEKECQKQQKKQADNESEVKVFIDQDFRIVDDNYIQKPQVM